MFVTCTLFKIYLRVYLFTYFMIWYVKISEQYIFHISYVFQRLISPSPALLRPTSPITSHPTPTSITGTASPFSVEFNLSSIALLRLETQPTTRSSHISPPSNRLTSVSGPLLLITNRQINGQTSSPDSHVMGSSLQAL